MKPEMTLRERMAVLKHNMDFASFGEGRAEWAAGMADGTAVDENGDPIPVEDNSSFVNIHQSRALPAPTTIDVKADKPKEGEAGRFKEPLARLKRETLKRR